MFTGIVQGMGRIAALRKNAFGARLVLDRQGWAPAGTTLAAGDSVCVSGTCLTLVEFAASHLSFDVIAQTLALTKLGRLKVGDAVNLESTLTPTSQLGGHFVQGHVDGVGTVQRVIDGKDEWRLTIAPPESLMDYMIPQGSLAIDGVSLTLAAVRDKEIEVALIPTTLQLTTLASLHVGDIVNLEADILAKTVVHFLRRREAAGHGGAVGGTAHPPSALTMDALHRAGF